jgi:hypothetical protein
VEYEIITGEDEVEVPQEYEGKITASSISARLATNSIFVCSTHVISAEKTSLILTNINAQSKTGRGRRLKQTAKPSSEVESNKEVGKPSGTDDEKDEKKGEEKKGGDTSLTIDVKKVEQGVATGDIILVENGVTKVVPFHTDQITSDKVVFYETMN